MHLIVYCSFDYFRGFKDNRTAEMMLSRAKKMKYNAERRKKLSKLGKHCYHFFHNVHLESFVKQFHMFFFPLAVECINGVYNSI